MIQTTNAQLLSTAMPEVLLVCTAFCVLMLDVGVLRHKTVFVRRAISTGLGAVGCAAALAWVCLRSVDSAIASGILLSSPLSRLVMIGLLLLSITALLLSTQSEAIEHVGEYVLLVLLSTVGMLALVSTQNLLTIFISLELLSLSLYLLTAFDSRSKAGAEASLKYFLFGGMSAAILLYGFSLLYGFANSTDLVEIGSAVAQHGRNSIIILAVVTTAIGFGFKVASAPFHFWVPDVYEAAPIPVVGFIASASKVASFYALFTILTIGFGTFAGSAGWFHVGEGWVPVLTGMATLSMLVGNAGALAQSNVRRLLGYSAIAHSGYMLIAIVSFTMQSLSALLFYVFSYGITVLGTFAVVGVVEEQTSDGKIESFNGLSRRAPLLSGCLFVFLLSQAGLPPLAGFFGKFYLFIAAVGGKDGGRGLLWLVVIALATSAIALYYYLGILKQVFVADPSPDASPIRCPQFTMIVVSALALMTIVLGCAPSLVLRWIETAIAATSHS
jgi:NADH-quinone oxidoreductase subunit N